jgi:hypothetical protein
MKSENALSTPSVELGTMQQMGLDRMQTPITGIDAGNRSSYLIELLLIFNIKLSP